MSKESDIFDALYHETTEWPFKSMSVGQVLSFTDKRAQVYCHVYGKTAGFRFRTRTDRRTGILYIKRIS